MTSILKVNSIQTAAGKPIVNDTGSVLQVKQQTSTSATEATTDWTAVLPTISITPSASSSEVLLNFTAPGMTNNCLDAGFRLKRGSTVIWTNDRYGYNNEATWESLTFVCNYLDSPATTSPTTYTWEIKEQQGEVRLNDTGTAVAIAMEIAG